MGITLGGCFTTSTVAGRAWLKDAYTSVQQPSPAVTLQHNYGLYDILSSNSPEDVAVYEVSLIQKLPYQRAVQNIITTVKANMETVAVAAQPDPLAAINITQPNIAANIKVNAK